MDLIIMSLLALGEMNEEEVKRINSTTCSIFSLCNKSLLRGHDLFVCLCCSLIGLLTLVRRQFTIIALQIGSIEFY